MKARAGARGCVLGTPKKDTTMSDTGTRQMIEMYMEEAEAPMFLSGFFQSPARNFHTTQYVELDVIRDDMKIAIPVEDLTAGARHNEAPKYVNKAFVPPIFKEQGAVNAFDMIKRRAGQNPFESPDFALNATNDAFRIFHKLDLKIHRAIELMASQVFQSGTLTLINENGVAIYTLNFLPKASHFVTVTTPWAVDGTTGDPFADIASLGRTLRRDGKRLPKNLIFGTSALQRFRYNTVGQKQLISNQNSQGQGAFMPKLRGADGANYIGFVFIDNYRFDLWGYDGFYEHPQTGTLTPYVADNNVIMECGGRLDLSYGAIPRITGPEARALPFLPSRMSSSEQGLDLTTNAWITPDGENLMVSAGTRPLTIPTAIDTIGCLTVA